MTTITLRDWIVSLDREMKIFIPQLFPISGDRSLHYFVLISRIVN